MGYLLTITQDDIDSRQISGIGGLMVALHTMDHFTESLPDYTNPPVIETVLGVQFDRLSSFKNAHLGAFWKTLDQAEWPTVGDAPLLPPQFETFQEGARWAKGVQFQVTQDPASRLQIKNRDSDRMIQVQNSRLHFNWLGKGGSCYLGYKNVSDEFFSVLSRFTDFIAENHLGDFRPNQWEVTYVNHIPQGTVWNSPADWHFFKPLATAPEINNLVEEESLSGEWHYIIPPKRGRLHIDWQHGVKPSGDKETHQEFIRLTLTGRGPVEQGDDAPAAIHSGFELGHETIVRTFKNLMSDNANTYWGLQHAGNSRT